ncbi:MAG: hypothetical protein AAGD11_19005 [Planctomycetota bacterium]
MDETQSSPIEGDDRSLQTAESLRALREQAGQTLGEHRERVGQIEQRVNSQLESLADELQRAREADEATLAQSEQQTAAITELRKTLGEKEAEVSASLEQLAEQQLAFEQQLVERDEELEQLLELNDQETQQRETLERELAIARAATDDDQQQECSECQRMHGELAATENQLDQSRQQLAALQSEHETALANLTAAQESVDVLQSDGEQVRVQLSDAERHIAELSKLEHADEQLEQTRRKFELALADVHKLKRENAELREELQSRPEADDQESPELVSLRSERDALAERVAELESAPAPAADSESQQELQDLQRRFELAVDDVRQLKQDNTELRQQLEAASDTPAARPSDDSQDWQAQKARLMAALDAEDQGMIDQHRVEERATIEGTISITDRIVAEKDALLAKRDAEIGEINAQLEGRPAGTDMQELRDQITAEVLGDDQAVQAECERLKHQQELLDTKLREAELEISLERAKLAREQASLEEKLALLPEMMAEEDSTPDKPRRRWLSALGLRDDDEES